ncbi:NAD-dependent epimerase/dehydratase family protein [Clostridium vincentii]|uniref:dTDP-6-deoxy-L-talose 4-dehydrogenase n=1 Tax=Clostridium vincentii TaxID=52704 RepID=A0A2T0BD32_9CLOT|nr:NAD(P)-dependent oxidoreductase [Clostridium vincentii]PRR81755.1 dTDP-6-deoxy-L-talose 4-dehydrogenase [Clostridium vincentii]
MKKILVTGANGYIGRHIVKTLLNCGYNVDACDFRFDGVDERANKIYTPIFNGDEDIYDKLGKPDICIHMAWRNGFVHNSETHIEDLNNHYTFLKNMITGGLKHLSVMGTMHEVGYWEGPIDENSPTNPSSLYGIAKNSLRQAIELMIKDNNIVLQWLRAYYITGDDLKSNSIFSKITKMEMEGKEKFPFTTGKNKYDFISVEELSEQIVAASTQTEVGGIINCCSGNPISLAEKVEEFIEKNNFKIKLQYGAFPDRKYDSLAVWGDNNKIQSILGVNPKE